jgi:ABC-type glutathione transport system ATPase component
MSGLKIESVSKVYRRSGRPAVDALQAVSWTIPPGEISGLVGESGSGKSTLARCIVGLEDPDTGSIELGDTVLFPVTRERSPALRRRVQLVFQDPTASLNPRMTVAQLVGEGLPRAHQRTRGDRVAELMELVGLDPRDAGRFPRSFSGGQKQRIAIARAVAVEPELLVCDEPVSALDVSVQAQVLRLMRELRDRLGLTILFVAHDLAVVRQLCTQVAVMEHGRLVEKGTAEHVLIDPQHPYTRSLVDAALVPDPILARARRLEARQTRRTLETTTPMTDRSDPPT